MFIQSLGAIEQNLEVLNVHILNPKSLVYSNMLENDFGFFGYFFRTFFLFLALIIFFGGIMIQTENENENKIKTKVTTQIKTYKNYNEIYWLFTFSIIIYIITALFNKHQIIIKKEEEIFNPIKFGFKKLWNNSDSFGRMFFCFYMFLILIITLFYLSFNVIAFRNKDYADKEVKKLEKYNYFDKQYIVYKSQILHFKHLYNLYQDHEQNSEISLESIINQSEHIIKEFILLDDPSSSKKELVTKLTYKNPTQDHLPEGTNINFQHDQEAFYIKNVFESRLF